MEGLEENETIESLKQRIQMLQDFILEDNSSVAHTAHGDAQSAKIIKDLERKVAFLTEEVKTLKQKNHNDELRNRMNLQVTKNGHSIWE
jgi:hypothetical protein